MFFKIEILVLVYTTDAVNLFLGCSIPRLSLRVVRKGTKLYILWDWERSLTKRLHCNYLFHIRGAATWSLHWNLAEAVVPSSNKLFLTSPLLQLELERWRGCTSSVVESDLWRNIWDVLVRIFKLIVSYTWCCNYISPLKFGWSCCFEVLTNYFSPFHS